MHLCEQVSVGPGTPRLTVAASALCATDRLLPSKYPTQGQVAEAANTVVPTSTDRIARFGLELVEAYVDENRADDLGIDLDEERTTLR